MTMLQVIVSQLLAAYKLYKMVELSVVNKKGYIISSSSKLIWTDPLYRVYKAGNGKCVSLEAEYTIKVIYDKLSEHDPELASSLKVTGDKGETEALRQ